MNAYLKRLVIAMAALMGVMGLIAGNALASSNSTAAANSVSLYRPFPNGISSNNAGQALQQVQSRAAWDQSYANAIAHTAGRTTYVASEYRAMGYASHASEGTTNSAVTGNGSVVPVADHNGSNKVKVFIMFNIVSSKTVELMVRCGNPRLKPSVSVIVIPWKPFKKGTVIRFNRTVTKKVSITCPSGQTVSGTVTVHVSGFVSGVTWGKVQGNLNLKLRVAINAKVKATVTLQCGPAPKPPPPTCLPPNTVVNGVCTPPTVTVFTATATATANASATCPDGTTATASGFGSATATSTVSQADAQAKAQAQATAYAQANASANIKCGTTPPPPAEKPTVSVNFVQEIDKSSAQFSVTARTCGHVKALAGHILNVSFTANYGHYTSSNLPPLTANGQDQEVCNTYTSPTENVKDQITITVVDSTASTSNSAVSNLFDIVTPPPPPG